MMPKTESKSFVFFTRMVDELVLFAQNSTDQELKDGIKWLDEKAQKEGITFYEITFRTLYKHDITAKAKAWRTNVTKGAST